MCHELHIGRCDQCEVGPPNVVSLGLLHSRGHRVRLRQRQPYTDCSTSIKAAGTTGLRRPEQKAAHSDQVLQQTPAKAQFAVWTSQIFVLPHILSVGCAPMHRVKCTLA